MIAELISSTDNSAFLMSRRVQIVQETRKKRGKVNESIVRYTHIARIVILFVMCNCIVSYYEPRSDEVQVELSNIEGGNSNSQEKGCSTNSL